jgi:hypothetical protein
VQTTKNIRLLFSFLDIKDVDLVHSVDLLCVLGALLICNQNNMELDIFCVLHYCNKRSILLLCYLLTIMLQSLSAGSHGQKRGHDGGDKCEDLKGRRDELISEPGY